MARLEFISGPLSGETVEVDRDLVIGRLDGDLIVDDQEVSGRHAMLQPTAEDGIQVTDLDSSNGTWIDGTRISAPTAAAAGSRLKFGGSEAAVVAASASAETRIAAQPAAPTAVAAAPPDPPIEDTPPPRQSTPVAPAPTPLAAPAPPAPERAPVARSSSRRGVAATRLRGAEVATYATVLLVAVALIVYFAAR